MKVLWIKGIGLGIGAMDGVILTKEDDNKKRSITSLVGVAYSNNPSPTKIYIFFYFRLIVSIKEK
ncbi:hypothetical protein [Poseidonibacter sp.]|uniref:hypothetical protein n=1 Tax=Poseidonibacter sp. TaxID=2321188 RepID=UPI003C780DDE